MRNLDWDGYFNARDLGGLPTPHSETGFTVYGRVARGPRRELLTARGWSDARRWGLSSVVDLRCPYEVGARDGDPVSSSNSLSGISLVNAPAEDHDDPEFREVCFPILDSPAYWRHNLRILPDLVRKSLEAIAHAEAGVLVHCSAGRDRTGMISTLLLGHAGVSPEDIAADYARSVMAMAMAMAGSATQSPTRDRQAKWTPDEAEAWVKKTAPIVCEVAAATDSAFDSLELGKETRNKLRSALTQRLKRETP